MVDTASGSRYRDTILFGAPDGDRPRFSGARPRPIRTAPGVLEHIVREKERLDLLALNYYNDSARWWRIVDANPEVVFGGDLVLEARVGSVILIPRSAADGASS
jgi:hypothetical protein